MVDYSEAYREAVASCPGDDIIYHTIEIRHPHFTNDNDENISIFLVRDYVELLAKLENTHPTHGGQQVVFAPVAFDITPPSKESGVVPQLQLSIDNVSAELMPYLDLAISEEIPVKVVYREYREKDLNTPAIAPIIFEASAVTASLTGISTTCQMTNISSKSVPNVEYTSANFPNLVQ
ncbi:MAG: DUF1833 domain-containing protein [Proteobacteria bacterium]|nr:DUF1833 domain-containing protein [Pseudomonadota bacterium]